LPLCFSSLLLFSVSDPETWVLLLCIQRLPLFYFYFFFCIGVRTSVPHLLAGALSLESHFQSFCFRLFFT
jgi:hypothetical protein